MEASGSAYEACGEIAASVTPAFLEGRGQHHLATLKSMSAASRMRNTQRDGGQGRAPCEFAPPTPAFPEGRGQHHFAALKSMSAASRSGNFSKGCGGQGRD